MRTEFRALCVPYLACQQSAVGLGLPALAQAYRQGHDLAERCADHNVHDMHFSTHAFRSVHTGSPCTHAHETHTHTYTVSCMLYVVHLYTCITYLCTRPPLCATVIFRNPA
jgi:hypothetical protein